VPRNKDGSFEADGLVKVRLVHARHGSVLLPDHILVHDAAPFWLQPLWVSPPILHFFSERSSAVLWVGVANKVHADPIVEVHFDAGGLVADLPDRSQLYKCHLTASVDVTPFRSGRWRPRPDGGVDLRLYHHTINANKKSILASREIWGSPWNFQGNKRLRNCSYAYFTSLQRIGGRDDLKRIGMAHDGRLALRLDQTPDGYPPDVVLPVYRESRDNRKDTVSLWVPAEHVAPSHVWKHTTDRVEYEVSHPWIYRVGMAPEGRYAFAGDDAAFTQPDLKHFQYLVLGDCTTKEGLAAPYDEEDTSETFLIEDLKGETLFDFWREHANQPLWRDEVELQKLEEPQ
jgi:hypothetical protein